MKNRIAIWLYGGIGTGNFSQGQPVLERLIGELCNDFEITVYSQSLVNSNYSPGRFALKFAPPSVQNGVLRWTWLVFCFLNDHLQKRYTLVCAFWGFPGGFLATILARILHLPSVVNLQGGDSTGISSLNYGVMHRPLFKRLALWSYQRATVLTTLTHFQRDLLTQYGISREVKVIPFGVDQSVFRNKARVTDPASLHFIHVANSNPIKDTPTLLRAFAIISRQKESRLRIVGGGYENSGDRQLCKELGIESRVEFCGPIVYSEMQHQYAWADMMLHTSLYEGQGIVVAEAAMSGILIAGTSVGLISDLGNRAAVLVSPGDHVMLAAKVLQVIQNPEIGERMKAAAWQWSNEHDFRWTVIHFQEILHGLA